MSIHAPIQLPFYANVEPESLLILAAFLWAGAALATGLPRGRFPSEFPLLFAIITIITAAIGITEYVPESIDIVFTFVGVVLFTLTPIFITWKLYRAYPPRKSDAYETRAEKSP